jgi:uncharacterized protein
VIVAEGKEDVNMAITDHPHSFNPALIALAAALALGVSLRAVAQNDAKTPITTNAQPAAATGQAPVDLSAVLSALLTGNRSNTNGPTAGTTKADLSALENMLLFQPSRKITETPEQAGLKFEEVSLLTADKVKLHAWWVPSETNRPALVFSHGNAGNIGHRLDKLKIFHDLGVNVLIYDYRGFGRSEGSPSEAGVYADVQAAYDYVLTGKQVAPAQIIAYGESLGGTMAAHLAATNKVGALILDSSFGSLKDMAKALMPMLADLVQGGYDTLADVKRVNVPVLVLHSPKDEIVPYAQGKGLFDAAAEPKQFVELKGGHNDGFLTSGKVYTEGLEKFLKAHFAPPEKKEGSR